MKKSLVALCLLAILFALSACGDNGVVPTLMGKFNKDYTFTASSDWSDVGADTTSLIMSSIMADDYIIEHTLVSPKGITDKKKVRVVQIMSNRGGPFSLEQIEAQYLQYLSRPKKSHSTSIDHVINHEEAAFRVNEEFSNSLTIRQRLYTQKGYVDISATCPSNDQHGLDEINSIIDSVAINSDIAYQ